MPTTSCLSQRNSGAVPATALLTSRLAGPVHAQSAAQTQQSNAMPASFLPLLVKAPASRAATSWLFLIKMAALQIRKTIYRVGFWLVLIAGMREIANAQAIDPCSNTWIVLSSASGPTPPFLITPPALSIYLGGSNPLSATIQVIPPPGCNASWTTTNLTLVTSVSPAGAFTGTATLTIAALPNLSPGIYQGPVSNVVIVPAGSTFPSLVINVTTIISSQSSPVLLCPTGNASVGVPYSSSLQVSGGVPPFTFGVISGALPAGLTLDPLTGAITGTPPVDYSANFTVQVRDSGSPPHSANAICGIVVVDRKFECSKIISNALQQRASGKNICAAFTPNNGYTLAQAAQLCGLKDFDWIQKITVQFDPSTFFARNLRGAFDPTITGIVRLTSKRVTWSDPPQGGGYFPVFSSKPDPGPDNSYPFYYDPITELPSQEHGPLPLEDACPLGASPGHTLTFHDAPSDGCLPGGASTGTAKCVFTAEPKGSFGGYYTHLAGVNFDGTATDLGIGFTWISTNNGTTGGVSIKKTDLPADGNGTGGITIIDVSETMNSAPPAPPPPLALGNACNRIYGGTFTGDVIISAGQNCTFTFGHITGNVRVDGGNLSLSAVLIGGNVQITGGTFSIGPATSITGDLEIHNIPAGTAQNQVCGSNVFGNLQVHDNGASVQIGSSSPSSCAGNVIDGNLEVHNNSASTAVFGNTVTGNLDDHNNTAPTQVFGNTITGNLQCVGNSSITGGSNTARQKQGQCSGF